jgi:PAS domain S-box-containing protein
LAEPFQDDEQARLAAEQRGRARAERALDRLSRLQRVTAGLSEALTPRQVAAVVVSHGIQALDAQAGRISVLGPDGRSATVIGYSGYSRVDTALSLDDALPTAEVMRTGQPLFVATNAEVLARFPRQWEVVEPVISGALCSAPLVVDGRVIGAMTLAFDGDREFEADDRELLVALARQCAQALERARLYELSLTVQEDLRRSRDQLAAILGGIGEGVTVQDLTGRLVYANAVAARLSGYASVEDFMADFPNTTVHFEMLDEEGEAFPVERLPGRELLRGKPATETVLQFRNVESGEWHWSIVDAAPVRDGDGRLQLVVNIFRDITDRKRQSDATSFLAAASTILASTLNIDASLQELVELAVPRIADWCSIDLSDQRGQMRRVAAAGDAQAGAGQSRSHVVADLVARGQTLGRVTLATAEVGRRFTAVDIELTQDLARRIALAIDNARLYQEAQEQAEHQAVLNAALRETIQERDRVMAALQDALQSRDEFLASASHDLKNPLASIKATVQLLQRRMARPEGVDPARIRDGLQRLDATVTRAAGLVDELLDLARLQMNRPLDLDRQPTDLVELTREVVSEHQQTTDRHVLTLEALESELVGLWDARRLGRVLSNLLDNAIKYSPQGGPIVVRVWRDGDWAAMEVADRGVGIPSDQQDRVFERFQRATNVAAWIGGTGIGLASARHILESHGGFVSLESEEGAGSTFTVRLPIALELPPDVDAAARPG